MTVLPMNNLQLLLFQTINPTTSKHATQQLASLEKDPTFTLNLLNLINDANDSNLQLTGAIYLKNFMKKYYHEENIIPNETKNLVKSNIVELCLKLNQQVQFQLYDVVNIIADCDFPDQWGDLIPALVNKFEMNSPSRANVSALQIVHGVISRWKGEYKSDHLFSQLKLVLSQFCVPYLELFKRTDMALDQLLLDPNQHKEKLSLVLETILLLLNIHLDFIGHDLPEFFEDNASTFFQLFLKYLKLDLKLNTENHDEPGFNEKIKTCICEIVDVFAKRYENEFEMLPTFVENIWNLLVTTGLESKNDLLVSKAIGFLTAVVKQPRHKNLFGNAQTLSQICEKIVIPNMNLREVDEESFDDDPMAYVHLDLEGSESDTRRRAASDLVRGLVEHFAQQVTEIFGRYIQSFLEGYAKDFKQNWKAKDTALYLITSLCAKGVHQQSGIISLNEFVPLVDLFNGHILTDLQAPVDGAIHPIVKVDCIKFVMIFRTQLPNIKDLIPVLISHLGSTSPAVYTYASICIEKVLTTRVEEKFLFSQSDILVFAQKLVEAHFQILAKFGNVAHKLAENEYIFKTIMRVVVLCREGIVPFADDLMNNTGQILNLICANPSNPKFNHFVFETIAALIRFIPGKHPKFLPTFEAVLMPKISMILQQDIVEFTPYALQLIAQLMDLHQEPEVPAAYLTLLPPLLQPVAWEGGNIPALVNLIECFVSKGAKQIAQNGQLPSFLGISQKLIASKLNDHFGFELLLVIFEHMPREAILPFINNIFVLLLKRLTGTAKTIKYSKGFVTFISTIIVKQIPRLEIETIVNIFDSFQPNLFSQLLSGVIIPNLKLMHTTFEKRVASVAMILLLSKEFMLQDIYLNHWGSLILELVNLVKISGVASKGDSQLLIEEEMYSLDADEKGYQSGFSKLSVIGKVKPDITLKYTDLNSNLKEVIINGSKKNPRVVEILNNVNELKPFLATLS